MTNGQRIEEVHKKIAPICGSLAIFLTIKKGLTKSSLMKSAEQLREAADMLEEICKTNSK